MRPADLQLAQRLADAAGAAIRPFFRSSFNHEAKADSTPVTEADRAAEAAIRAILDSECPADAIIGEEDGGNAAGSERVWLIDPIDGTANYARGIPHYCVSIGYLERGVPTVGAVHDPSHDWLYSAARGEGVVLDAHDDHERDVGGHGLLRALRLAGGAGVFEPCEPAAVVDAEHEVGTDGSERRELHGFSSV